jgi:hypothetical protein
MEFTGKTIILGAPKHYDFDKFIEQELINLGFMVINISFHNNQYKYKNIFERIECFLVNNILWKRLWKRQHKAKIEFRANERYLNEKLQVVVKADYLLLIRPDVYPISFIYSLKAKASKLVAYQWDGLNRFPEVYSRINLFDRFFVFNGKDLYTPSVLPMTNFYPVALNRNLYDRELKSDVFYAGYFISKRTNMIAKLIKDFEQLGLDFKYHLFHKKKKDLAGKTYGFKVTNEQLNYLQNIRYTYNTKTILDLVSPEHEGLSFRVFEAIGFDKKLITTNYKVKEYDFYHPNNIMIWQNNDIKELEDFLNKPYILSSIVIKEKYSFTNWIKYALGEGNYITVNIPT